MYPDFIVGGVQKSGTTFLDALLQNHPQIQMIDRNLDFSFFDDDRIYINGIQWYKGLFENIYNNKIPNGVVGQTSADCAFNTGSIERLMDSIPNVKLIFVLRHPIDRTYSLYWHQYGMGREHYHFEKALSKESNRIKKSYYNFKTYPYMERSRYKKQFEIIQALVPKENLLILPFDALVKNTKPTINEVLKYLNVDEIANLDELNFDNLPRNKARIPSNQSIVVLSSYIQKMGLIRIGRRLVNMFRVEGKPPKMKMETYKFLEKELAVDIEFYKKTKKIFELKINK